MTPFRRAAAVHSPFAPELRDAVAQGSRFLRQEVEVAFAPEIAAAAPGDRRQLVDTLAAATSWGVWDGLRADAGDTPGAGAGPYAAAPASPPPAEPGSDPGLARTVTRRQARR